MLNLFGFYEFIIFIMKYVESRELNVKKRFVIEIKYLYRFMLIHYTPDGYQVTSGLYSLVYDRRFRWHCIGIARRDLCSQAVELACLA